MSLGFDDYGKNNSENNIEQSSSENVEVVKYTPDSIYTSQLVKDVILQSEGKNSKE